MTIANVNDTNDDKSKASGRAHFLDLKIPLGCLITFYGLVLILYGYFTDSAVYQKSLNINVNVIWGCVMLVIGVVLLVAAVITHRNKSNVNYPS